ncbi:hypothetical protein AN958_03547 [Leucoagaricus sp. SymC.cos]|nr:hypothetical protein AN958_03547 [Leucoagaricus sp. SymC.cos]
MSSSSTLSVHPVAYGHALLDLFQLSSDYTNLNSGSFGVLPKSVAEACDILNAEIESNPDRFIRIELGHRLNQARIRLASYLGVPPNTCVLVTSVAAGINTILRNIQWSIADIILLPTTSYYTIARNVHEISQQTLSPRIQPIDFTLPSCVSSILSQFEAEVSKAVDSLTHTRGERTHGSPKVVALFDSIVSTPGLLLPWKSMVQICKENGVLSIVDAAHSIGQEQDLNLEDADPDFWISNCSKWLYAKRGCAVLYIPERNQSIIHAAVPPSLPYLPATGDEETSAFVDQFYWSGSFDIASLLSAPAALEFRKSIGGDACIADYCQSLASRGGRMLAEILSTEIMELSGEGKQPEISMINVKLPLPDTITPSAHITRSFQSKLLVTHRIYAAHFYYNKSWWVRLQMQDFERLGRALLSTCAEIAEEEAGRQQ